MRRLKLVDWTKCIIKEPIKGTSPQG